MKRGTPDHPKVYDLCEALGRRRPECLGYLELLWHFTAKYAPEGNIGRFSERRIEAALDWIGPKGRLISALVGAGWVDVQPSCGYVVHDWSQHCDDSVRRYLGRVNKSFVCSHEDTGNLSGKCTDSVRKSSECQSEFAPLPMPLPLPLPEPIIPTVQAPPRKRATPIKSDPQQAEWFTEEYAFYPKHEARADAERAHRKHVKTQERHEAVMDLIRRRVGGLERETQFIPNFATWLNREHWKDEIRDTARRNDGPRLWTLEEMRNAGAI